MSVFSYNHSPRGVACKFRQKDIRTGVVNANLSSSDLIYTLILDFGPLL